MKSKAELIASVIPEINISYIDKLLKRFKIRYKSELEFSLYIQAFTHSSFANFYKINSYETLEFYGDAIIQFLSTKYIIESKGIENIDAQFGTKLRSICVDKNALSKHSFDFALNKCLLILDKKADLIKNIKINEDIFESFIGAVYINCGVSKVITILKETIFKDIDSNLSRNSLDFTDYKSRFQENVQANLEKNEQIKYICKKTNLKNWKCELFFADKLFGVGENVRKKDAQQDAAKMALEKKVA